MHDIQFQFICNFYQKFEFFENSIICLYTNNLEKNNHYASIQKGGGGVIAQYKCSMYYIEKTQCTLLWSCLPLHSFICKIVAYGVNFNTRDTKISSISTFTEHTQCLVFCRNHHPCLCLCATVHKHTSVKEKWIIKQKSMWVVFLMIGVWLYAAHAVCLLIGELPHADNSHPMPAMMSRVAPFLSLLLVHPAWHSSPVWRAVNKFTSL